MIVLHGQSSKKSGNPHTWLANLQVVPVFFHYWVNSENFSLFSKFPPCFPYALDRMDPPAGFLLTRTLEAQRLLGRTPPISSVVSNHGHKRDAYLQVHGFKGYTLTSVRVSIHASQIFYVCVCIYNPMCFLSEHVCM